MGKIPEFENRREAADFFDQHGVDEYLDATEEVEIAAKRPLSVVLSVRLDPKHLANLRALAKVEGRGIATMARLLLSKAIDAQGDLERASRLHVLDVEVQALKRRVSDLEAGPASSHLAGAPALEEGIPSAGVGRRATTPSVGGRTGRLRRRFPVARACVDPASQTDKPHPSGQAVRPATLCSRPASP